MAFKALLVLSHRDFRVLDFVYDQKRQWKVLRNRIIFKNVTTSRVYDYNITNIFNVKFSGYYSVT